MRHGLSETNPFIFQLSIFLRSSTYVNLFSIDPLNGVINLARILHEEHLGKSYDLLIEARDGRFGSPRDIETSSTNPRVAISHSALQKLEIRLAFTQLGIRPVQKAGSDINLLEEPAFWMLVLLTALAILSVISLTAVCLRFFYLKRSVISAKKGNCFRSFLF